MTTLEVMQRATITAQIVGGLIDRIAAPARAAIAIGEKITNNKPVIPEMPYEYR